MRTLITKRSGLILVLKTALILIVAVGATSSTSQTVSYTGEVGQNDKVSNFLLSTAKGFSKTSASAAAGVDCSSPVTFGSGTVANTLLTAGDIIFDVQVNTTGSTPANSCFTVTFYVSTSIGSQTTYGPVYISTGGTVTPGQAIDCKFDLGSASLPAPPFSYKVVIQ